MRAPLPLVPVLRLLKKGQQISGGTREYKEPRNPLEGTWLNAMSNRMSDIGLRDGSPHSSSCELAVYIYRISNSKSRFFASST